MLFACFGFMDSALRMGQEKVSLSQVNGGDRDTGTFVIDRISPLFCGTTQLSSYDIQHQCGSEYTGVSQVLFPASYAVLP